MSEPRKLSFEPNFKPSNKTISHDRQSLLNWYHQNKRNLPWRNHANNTSGKQNNPDPYKIWISEVMLQQTTVTAVIPYYEKFIARFPNVQTLAQSTLEDVYEYWAGLGYYSRARNLHKAAQQIFTNFEEQQKITLKDPKRKLSRQQKKTVTPAQNKNTNQNQTYQHGFPQSYQQLLELPGFGPYTARAVSSLAFGEKVGVLDGNVIRALSRKYGIDSNWWEPKERQKLQALADQLAQTEQVSELNQALMELGATVCTPKKVMCLLCPWKKTCVSLKENKISDRPRMKKRPQFEIWTWQFQLQTKTVKGTKHIYLEENTTTPFLKNNWLPPSSASINKIKPVKKNYHFKHGVTKYEIFVSVFDTAAGKQIEKEKSLKEKVPGSKAKIPAQKIISRAGSTPKQQQGRWIPISEVVQINPTNLMKKIIAHIC